MYPAIPDRFQTVTNDHRTDSWELTVQPVPVEGDKHPDGPHQVWVVGDSAICVVIDASSGPNAVLPVVNGRTVVAVVCTHGHDDHVRHARELGRATSAPVLLHANDVGLWHETHAEAPDRLVVDHEQISVGGAALTVIHTPGHTPGSISLYCPELATVFTGGTLVDGGPCSSRRPGSDRDAIVDSIAERLMALPPETTVRAGCGPETSLGAERAVIDCLRHPYGD